MAPSDQATNYLARKTSDGFYLFGFTGQNQTSSQALWESGGLDFYAGPKDQVVLETIAPYLNLTVDYGFFGGSPYRCLRRCHSFTTWLATGVLRLFC